MTIFYTADQHYGHTNKHGGIVAMAKRPFASVWEMDEEMIRRHNSRVTPGDRVIHVGDFAKGDHAPYLRRLNGMNELVKGNHDHSKNLKQAIRQHLWHATHDMLTVHDGDTDIVCCHYGLRVWNKSHRGVLHFYGHSHGKLPGDSQCCDVGVDCWDFYPVTLEEIKTRLATLRERGHPDHHQPQAA